MESGFIIRISRKLIVAIVFHQNGEKWVKRGNAFSHRFVPSRILVDERAVDMNGVGAEQIVSSNYLT